MQVIVTIVAMKVIVTKVSGYESNSGYSGFDSPAKGGRRMVLLRDDTFAWTRRDLGEWHLEYGVWRRVLGEGCLEEGAWRSPC